MKKRQAYIVELEIIHPCLNIEAMDKAKDKDAQIIMKAVLKSDKRGASHLFTLKSSKAKQLLDAHRRHPLTKSLDIISRSEERIDFVLLSEPDIGIAHALAKSRCIPLEPVITEEEVDRVVLFAPSWKAYREFIDSLPESFECKMKRKRIIDEGIGASLSSFQSIGFLEFSAAAQMLTNRQLEILDIAIAKGYYETPRKITMEELADYLDISTPTLHEHLTKMEAKILPVLSKVLRAIK